MTKPSGLRNPPAAVRGAGSGVLAGEALVMLLAIVPLRVVGAHLSGIAIGVVIGLAVLCLVLIGLLRYGWAWPAGFLPPIALIVSGFVFHASLAILGVLFGLSWLYVLRVRKKVLG